MHDEEVKAVEISKKPDMAPPRSHEDKAKGTMHEEYKTQQIRDISLEPSKT